MNYCEVTSINIDGKYFNREGLIDFSKSKLENPKTPAWQKSIFSFLLLWLNDEDHIIVKTSGSTGTPKPIRIKKQHMVNSALKTGAYLGLKKSDVALLCLSADYIAGKMMLVRSMVLELDLMMVKPSANPLENNNENFDFAAMVPMQVYTILEEDDGIEKLNRIQNLIIGGAAVPAALKQKIKSLGNHTFSTYGMTETITHIAMEKLNGPEADGFLRLLPGIKIKPNPEKRLIISAPDISDEMIITNDLAEIREDGSFRILGRADNIIISGGLKIIPEIIEKKIEPLIDERFVISSLPDEKLGKKLVLVIEDQTWTHEKTDALQQSMTEILHPFENPKQIIFITKIPETSNQKTDRLAIKNLIHK